MSNQKLESNRIPTAEQTGNSSQINLSDKTKESEQSSYPGRTEISIPAGRAAHGKITEKTPNRLRNNLVIIASLIIILAGIHASKVILAPVFMSIFLSILLLPPLKGLRSSLKMSEGLSLTVVIFIVVGCGLSITTILASQLTDFARNLPAYRAKFDDLLHNYDLNLGNFIPMLKSDKEEEPSASKEPSQAVRQHSAKSSQVSSLSSTPLETAEDKSSSPGSTEASAPAEHSGAAFNAETKTAADKKSESTSVSASAASKETSPDRGSSVTESVSDSNKEKDQTGKPGSAGSPQDSDISNAAASGKVPSKSGKGIKVHSEALKPGGFFTNDEPVVKFDEIAHTSALAGDPDPPHEIIAADSETSAHRRHYQLPSVNITTEGAVKASSHELFQFLASLTSELSVLGSKVFIITLLTIFMLMEASNLPKKVDVSLGDRARQVASDIWHYMLIKSFVSLLVGLLVTVLLVVTNVRYPVLWGCLAFLLNYIPNIGSAVAAIPPLLLATVDYGLAVGMIDAIFFVIINCGIGYFLEPKLLGEGLDLSPIVVLLSLIFFGWLLGPIGMFLSPPLAVIGKIILKSFPETEWIANVMANRPPEKKNFELRPESAEK